MSDQSQNSPAPDQQTPSATPEAPKKKSLFGKWLHFPKSWKEVKQLGWKFILGFIVFYLIRDLILYVLIPYLVYEGFVSK
jgi:hypothetical protein